MDVALTVGTIEYYNLKLLSDDDCWSVFVKHAFEKRDVVWNQFVRKLFRSAEACH